MITRVCSSWGSKSALLAVAAASLGAGCKKTELDDQGQIGDAVGEVMASADESANGGTTTAMLPALPVIRLPDALRPPLWRRALDAIEPSAEAASCFPLSFAGCASGVRTETFGSCALGSATLDGSVTLTFSDTNACLLAAAGDAVTRTADFTLTGPYGGTLTVTSPGGGQMLSKTAGGFTFAVAGMERVLVGPGGHTLFDVSTATTAPLTITGSSRADLTIVSGALEVTHHLAGYSVALTADNLKWANTCNCAVSGSLTGTVSGGPKDGKSATVTITSCGHADVTVDGDSDSVTLDRCAAI